MKTQITILIILILVIIQCCNSISAQNIGIGATSFTPHESAMLDVEADNKGILVPRVNIADLSTAAPITSPAVSLLVYNTNETTSVGFYYWDGTEWKKLITDYPLADGSETIINAGTNISISGTGIPSNPYVISSNSGTIPSMSTNLRMQILNPVPSMQIYNTDLNCFEFYNGTAWNNLCGLASCMTAPPNTTASLSDILTNSFRLNWSLVATSDYYSLDVSTNSNFTSFVQGYQNLDVGNVSTFVVTGLAINTTYYVRIKPANFCGISNSNVVTVSTTFACGISSIQDMDGNIYNTVQIGSQCWTKQNLNTTKAPNGSSITRFCYNHDVENCNVYGGLYNWPTIMNGATSSTAVPSGVRGICPLGWHIPSRLEFTNLINFLTTSTAAAKMKVDANNIPPWNGNNQSGFSALPAGHYWNNFSSLGTTSGMWTSTQYSSTNAYYLQLTNTTYNDTYLEKNPLYFSIRCIKD